MVVRQLVEVSQLAAFGLGDRARNVAVDQFSAATLRFFRPAVVRSAGKVRLDKASDSEADKVRHVLAGFRRFRGEPLVHIRWKLDFVLHSDHYTRAAIA